mgnify:CR=1 FL=1
MFKIKVFFRQKDFPYTFIDIYRTYKCFVSSKCKCRSFCPYAKQYKTRVYFKNLLKDKFGIVLNTKSYLKDLSGTNQCPYHMSRVKDCYHCRNTELTGWHCYSEVRANAIKQGLPTREHVDDEYYPETDVCKFFEPVDWFKDYGENE